MVDSGSRWVRAVAQVAERSTGGPVDAGLRVTVHFHPDGLVGGVPVLAALAAAGVCLPPGVAGDDGSAGDRRPWESRMFAGAYDRGPAACRPVHGALNFRRRRVGGAPRLGSAHLRLAAHTLARTTFCFPDGGGGHPDRDGEPWHVGVAGRVSTVVALAAMDRGDVLDDYVAAQVHGAVAVPGDVEALVLDPCFRGTEVEAAAGAVGCPVEWHGGFVLPVGVLRRHPEYRGPAVVALGVALARRGRLDPLVLGDAVRGGCHDGQLLTGLWHCVARFGSRELAGGAG